MVDGEVYAVPIGLGVVGEHTRRREVYRHDGVRLIAVLGPQARHVARITRRSPVVRKDGGGLAKTAQDAAQSGGAAERIAVRANVREDQEIVVGTQEGRCLLRREPILRNVRHPVHDGELSKDRAQARLQATDDRAAILCRHTVERLGDGTGNGGESIAVTADGDGVADAVLEVGAFEEGFDRIGDRPGTGGSEVIEDVVRPDLVEGEANLVILLNV